MEGIKPICLAILTVSEETVWFDRSKGGRKMDKEWRDNAMDRLDITSQEQSKSCSLALFPALTEGGA